ncbi:FecR family protein [Roseateles sp. L2-2]|uniref:FecR family protein n=1 Tax=Roseateles sp. L2-2 TaxID=3422597 RepID=UPI003D36FD54
MTTTMTHVLREAALIAAMTMVSLAAHAQACEVAALAGDATRVVAGQTQPLRLGDKVGEGAQLRTGDNGRVRLRCPDGSSLVVGDRSQLTLTRLNLGIDAGTGVMPGYSDGARDVSLLLERGLLSQKVTPSGSGKWEVRTPSAVTAVRGTEFLVEVGENEQTAVLVQSGQVAVLPGPRAAGRTRGLGAQLPVLVDRSGGTDCEVSQGCTAATQWPADRVRAVLDRLSGV